MSDIEEKKLYKKYRELYSSDQENLYKSFFVRLLFNLGHYFIAWYSKNIKGKTVDVGAGVGYHLQFEDPKKLDEYICLDVDRQTLNKIENKQVKKLVAQGDKIPLPSESIDLVIASHILEHLPNLDKSLKEFDRILKREGKLLVVLPCDPGFMWRLLTYFSPSRKRLKALGFDYDVIMKYEHVNSFNKCYAGLLKSFKLEKEIYFPLLIKNHNFNILCCLKLTKK